MVGRHHVAWNWRRWPSSRGSLLLSLPQAASRQIFWRTLVARRLTQRSGARAHRARTRRRQDKPKNTSRYIRWSELLRRTFGIEILCTKCKSPLRLIALIKTEDIAKKILKAMHLPSDVPQLHPARPPRPPTGGPAAAMTGSTDQGGFGENAMGRLPLLVQPGLSPRESCDQTRPAVPFSRAPECGGAGRHGFSDRNYPLRFAYAHPLPGRDCRLCRLSLNSRRRTGRQHLPGRNPHSHELRTRDRFRSSNARLLGYASWCSLCQVRLTPCRSAAGAEGDRPLQRLVSPHPARPDAATGWDFDAGGAPQIL